jgi:prepilin-type N-terminal cleavage/methylation domain-containing protein
VRLRASNRLKQIGLSPLGGQSPDADEESRFEVPDRRSRDMRQVPRRRIGKHAAAPDAGFTIVEVLVAISLLTVVLLCTLQGVIVSLSAASTAKQRAIATGLISGDIATLTALPYISLQQGLNPAVDSLSTDPRITATVTNGLTTYVFTGNGATIPASNTASSQSPLVPHIQTVNIGTSRLSSCANAATPASRTGSETGRTADCRTCRSGVSPRTSLG